VVGKVKKGCSSSGDCSRQLRYRLHAPTSCSPLFKQALLQYRTASHSGQGIAVDEGTL
jgi:hypothetical protein